MIYRFDKELNNEIFKPYVNRKNLSSIDRGIIMWRYRVVMPLSLRKNVLKKLRSNHEGMVKMKTLAKLYFWWPSVT